ncbi:hypothetical protein Tco_1007672 [Tanacetum coccineum]
MWKESNGMEVGQEGKLYKDLVRNPTWIMRDLALSNRAYDFLQYIMMHRSKDLNSMLGKRKRRIVDVGAQRGHELKRCMMHLVESSLGIRLDNQSIERDRLIGIGFVLDFVEFISFTFSDKEMISVIESMSKPMDLIDGVTNAMAILGLQLIGKVFGYLVCCKTDDFVKFISGRFNKHPFSGASFSGELNGAKIERSG